MSSIVFVWRLCALKNHVQTISYTDCGETRVSLYLALTIPFSKVPGNTRKFAQCSNLKNLAFRFQGRDFSSQLPPVASQSKVRFIRTDRRACFCRMPSHLLLCLERRLGRAPRAVWLAAQFLPSRCAAAPYLIRQHRRFGKPRSQIPGTSWRLLRLPADPHPNRKRSCIKYYAMAEAGTARPGITTAQTTHRHHEPMSRNPCHVEKRDQTEDRRLSERRRDGAHWHGRQAAWHTQIEIRQRPRHGGAQASRKSAQAAPEKSRRAPAMSDLIDSRPGSLLDASLCLASRPHRGRCCPQRTTSCLRRRHQEHRCLYAGGWQKAKPRSICRCRLRFSAVLWDKA